jgi:hypothetical protein
MPPDVLESVWYKILKDFGPSGLAVVFLIWIAPKCAKWVAENILLPLRDAGISHLRNIDRATDTIDANMTKIANHQATIAVHQEEMVDAVTNAIGATCSIPQCPILASLETIRAKHRRESIRAKPPSQS